MLSKKVAMISPCGWGNLGDAAILDTVIQQIRIHDENTEFIGLTLNPYDTEWRHQIDAMAICGFTRPNYSVTQSRQTLDHNNSETKNRTVRKSIESVSTNKFTHGFRIILKRVPGIVATVKKARTLKCAIDSIFGEVRHLWKSFQILRRIDLLIVAGGGQLDDFWGGPWGQPYVLFRWAILAKLTSTQFVVLSVGVGQLQSSLSKYFIKKTLDVADYRSYRDQKSKDMLSFASITRTDPVIPDLAFGYPVKSATPSTTPKIIGISPMNYKGPIGWPDADYHFYSQYITLMINLIRELINSGYRVILFPSVRGDRRVIDKILDDIEPQIREKIQNPQVNTVAALMETLSSIDLTIASRLHGILLSQLARRPVVALSYERKVDTLMRDFGNERFCFSINTFSVSDIKGAVDSLISDISNIQSQNDSIIATSTKAVNQQFDQLINVSRLNGTV